MKNEEKIKTKSEFSEKDIQATILYLKTNTSISSSRKNAINYLQGVKGISHLIAHKIVKNENK